MKIVVKLYPCFYLLKSRVKNISASHTVLPARRLRIHKELGGDRAISWPKLVKGIFYTLSICMTYSTIKSGLKKEEEGIFQSMVIIFPSNHYAWWHMLYQLWLTICLPMGSSEWTPHFVSIVYADLLYIINCLFINLTSHTFPVLSHTNCGDLAVLV